MLQVRVAQHTVRIRLASVPPLENREGHQDLIQQTAAPSSKDYTSTLSHWPNSRPFNAFALFELEVMRDFLRASMIKLKLVEVSAVSAFELFHERVRTR